MEGKNCRWRKRQRTVMLLHAILAIEWVATVNNVYKLTCTLGINEGLPNKLTCIWVAANMPTESDTSWVTTSRQDLPGHRSVTQCTVAASCYNWAIKYGISGKSCKNWANWCRQTDSCVPFILQWNYFHLLKFRFYLKITINTKIKIIWLGLALVNEYIPDYLCLSGQ